MPLNVVLFEPEIAPNTGNIIRLCANTGSCLHLIGQLGFTFDDKKLKRAGLDYKEWASIKFWDNLESYINQLTDEDRIFAFTTKAKKKYHDNFFKNNDSLLFGPETRGLPDKFLNELACKQKLKLPMVPESRSLNLSNSVAVAVYEAWRQLNFFIE